MWLNSVALIPKPRQKNWLAVCLGTLPKRILMGAKSENTRLPIPTDCSSISRRVRHSSCGVKNREFNTEAQRPQRFSFAFAFLGVPQRLCGEESESACKSLGLVRCAVAHPNFI